MYATIRRTSNTAIRQWWQYVKNQHPLFFGLMDSRCISISCGYLRSHVQQLRSDYNDIAYHEYPQEAEAIWSHLLDAIYNVVTSLERMSEKQMLETNIRLTMASIDMDLVKFELLQQGIYE